MKKKAIARGTMNNDRTMDGAIGEVEQPPAEAQLIADGWERHHWRNRHTKLDEVKRLLNSLGPGGQMWAYGPPEDKDDGSLTVYVRRVN